MDNLDIKIPGYIVHGEIGQGGMASVYLATQESLNRKVAIKVLHANANAAINERFVKEAHFIASLSNPHIITIYDIAALENGDNYIAMEFLNGGDLMENQHRFTDPAHALRLILQIAEGLAVVHEKGIIHRDVKPANILFRDNGDAVLTDFGIAKDLDNNSDLTVAGYSLGSPAYSSPEQAQGQPLDITTDIYGLGVVLIELLLGYNPFRGDSHTGTAINHIQQPVPAMPAGLEYLAPLLERMLAKQSASRFQSCHELVTAIKAITLDERKARAPSSNPVFQKLQELNQRMGRQRTRRLLPAAGLVTLLLVVFAMTSESELDREIRRLLTQADQKLAEGHYIRPERDNARFYYREVLLLDADNSRAQRGLESALEGVVEGYVQQGSEALEKGRLNRPKGNNATYFYREALALDSDNPKALAGLEQVASEFGYRARASLLEGDLKGADYNVKRGLRISRENDELLALRAEVDRRMPAAKKFIGGVFDSIRDKIEGRD